MHPNSVTSSMSLSDRDCFRKLKAAVETRFRSRHPACTRPLHAWKGQDIVDFQEDLATVVKGRISEKWFYTHMKADHDKLPRIDMLNLLSAYAGAESWEAFRYGLRGTDQAQERQVNPMGKQRKWIPWTAAAALLILLTATAFIAMKGNTRYTFCFVDADRGTAIAGAGIEIQLLMDGETPRRRKVNANGCFEYESGAKSVRFIVHAPYYHSDTVTRSLDPARTEESIPLRTDDYALMIHLFSTAKVEDWQKRKQQLDRMIAEEAQLFQLDASGEIGMEMYNKQEFIFKMTMPINSLRDIEILETQYDRNGKIKGMRFIQSAPK